MKTSHVMFGLWCLVSVALAEAAPVRVVPNGETVVDAIAGGMSARVRIRAHEREIAQAAEGRPAGDISACTYSRVPCLVVDAVEIQVNGQLLEVPRSVSRDLADLTTVELRLEGDQGRMILNAGDASESLVVEIEFDRQRVKRRTVASALRPDEILEETVFREPTRFD